MGVHQFRLVLKSGPDKIRGYKEDAAQSFKRGELIKPTDTTEIGAFTGSTVDTAILGVAAKDGQNTTTPSEKAEIYVISPEQVWELHVASGTKPTAYTIGHNYQINMTPTSNTAFVITREKETASASITVRGPVLNTSTTGAGTHEGVVIVGYSSDATKDKKGQKVLVRFTGEATVDV